MVLKSGRKASGGKYHKTRKRKAREHKGKARVIKLADKKTKTMRTTGGNEKQVSLYCLDFVIGKIDLEIDGEQHYINDELIEKDVKRNEFLENLGYSVIRIRWSEYKSLDKNNRKKYVNKLIENLNR